MIINVISVGHYFEAPAQYSRFGQYMRRVKLRKNNNNTIHLVYED